MYYELLKPNQTVTAEYFQQQLIDLNRALNQKRPIIAQRKCKVILLHDNARHVAKISEHFFDRGTHLLPEKWEKDIASDERYLEQNII